MKSNIKKQEGILDITKNESRPVLLMGPFGSGKTIISREMIKVSVCEKGIGCGECERCLKIEKNVYPDYRYYNCDKMKIDEVREIIDGMAVYPHEDKYLIVLDNVDRLRHDAQTVLLKTLEEKKNAIFILTATSQSEVLSTIISRCVPVNINLFEESELIEELLEKYENLEDDEFLKDVAYFSEGSLGQAMVMIEEREAFEEFINGIKSIDEASFYILPEKYMAYVKDKLMSHHFILSVLELIINKKCIEMYDKEDAVEKLYEGQIEIVSARSKIRNNANMKLSYQNIISKIYSALV